MSMCDNIHHDSTVSNRIPAVSKTTGATDFSPKHGLIFVTNNPQWANVPSLKHRLSLYYTTNNALDVLITARNHIHAGWQLLNHPLYGNFRPYQQPFRSLLLQRPKNNDHTLDTYSLHLIEQALTIYQDCGHPIMELENLHTNLVRDCVILDMALLETTLETFCQHSFITLTPHKE